MARFEIRIEDGALNRPGSNDHAGDKHKAFKPGLLNHDMAVKKTVKKAASKAASKAAPKKEAKKEEKMKKVGEVTHFFGGIGVAAIKLSSGLKVGDSVLIKGATTDLKQKIASMQIEGKAVQAAKKGQEVGTKVSDRVRENDIVYLA